MKYWTLLSALAAASVPTRGLAFHRQLQLFMCHDSADATSRSRRNNNKLLPFSMPPLSNHTSSSGNIFKVLKRGRYPTVDLPYEKYSNRSDIDHYFMGIALQQAKRAGDRGEVPIGAVIVREYGVDMDDVDYTTSTDEMNLNQNRRAFQILSATHNRVEIDVDASAHAELLALRKGARNLQNWRFPPNSRIYTTVEPCPMCLASIQAFRIDHIVYGCPDNRLGAITTHMDLMNVAKHPYHEVKSVTGGVRADECGDIMVQFFRERRRKKKEVNNKSKLLKLARGAGQERFRFRGFLKELLRR